MSRTALATAAALSFLCACTKSHTFKTNDASVTVTDKGKDEGSVHINGKDGTSLDINTGKPIADYPADVPLYSGKTLMDMKAGQKRVVSLQTPDPTDKIVKFYKSELEAKGWKIETDYSSATATAYVATKDARKLSVSITSEPSDKLQTVTQSITDK